MKKLLIALMALAACVTAATAAKPSAASVIDATCAKIGKAPSVTARFTATMGAQKVTGNITLSGKRFKMQADDLTVWFDGTTQWAYSARAGEVNITEPDTEELAQINPLAVIQNLKSNYSMRQLDAPAGTYRIELTPKGRSDFKSVVVTVDAATSLPKALTITASDGAITKVEITSIAEGGKVNDSTFRFSRKMMPGVEVVDLR